MAETIIRMAHSLKLDVIAEGVETAEQLAFLARQGCDQIQGYYFSRPLPVAELEVLLRASTRLVMPPRPEGDPVTTVLVVHSDGERLSTLERLLQRDGYRILTARSAALGLELLVPPRRPGDRLRRRRRACPTGWRWFGRATDLYPQSLCIVLSESPDSRKATAMVDRGALYGFHAEPWDAEALRDNVREAGRHHRRLNADVSPRPTQADPVTV